MYRGRVGWNTVGAQRTSRFSSSTRLARLAFGTDWRRSPRRRQPSRGPAGHNPLEPARLGCPFISGGPCGKLAGLFRTGGSWRDEVCCSERAGSLFPADPDGRPGSGDDVATGAGFCRGAGSRHPICGWATRRDVGPVKMRTPRRWYRRDRRGSAVIGALARIGASVWAAATARRIARGRPLDVGAPVICVGI